MATNHQRTKTVVAQMINAQKSLAAAHNAVSGRISRVGNQLAQISEYLEATSLDLLQGEPFTDHLDAFADAKSKLPEILEQHIGCTLQIKILAVASSFSWHFLTDVIKDALRNSHSNSFDINLLLIRPDHLNTIEAGRNAKGKEWHNLAHGRLQDAKDFVSALPKEIAQRYFLTISYYQNLPHWHGVLINDALLYLGRTSWEWVDGKPNLRVGENTYRLFTRGAPQGEERIELFLNWFDYYSEKGETAFTNRLEESETDD